MGADLSIIVPFYDETAFLPMALQSIAAQPMAAVEIVVVNDNPARFGPDDFAGMDLPPGIRILHHDVNRGLSAARNTGVAASTGALVGFLDSDDYYLAGGLAAQAALAQQSGADITHANACISAVGSPSVKLLPRDKALFDKPRKGAGLQGIEEAQFITSSWASLYRRDFLDGAGLAFDPAQVKFEDRLFVLQTVTAARSIACMGAPARVWRRRAGSISTSPADPVVLGLQVALLEKCMSHMRAHAAAEGVPGRFLKREVFNTLSRLIWDMALLSPEAAADPGHGVLCARVQALLGDDRFGQTIFDDPVLTRISRVGVPSRRGLVRRTDFFAVHRMLREGAFAEATDLLAERQALRQPVARPARRNGVALVLHLGMHKTGSTWLQHALQEARPRLRAAGVLFPQSGLANEGFAAVRPGGFPGHLGLLAALRKGDEGPWQDLAAEIAASGCHTVVLSCENMLMPVSADREEMTARLAMRLRDFASIQPVAFVRRPDVGPEMLYRELACNGQRAGARSPEEFLVDFGEILTDLPRLFAPWEALAGRPVALVDHDASARAGAHWPRFLLASGLAGTLGHLPPPGRQPAYPTPDRAQTAAARLVNTLMPQEKTRIAVLRAFFAAAPPLESRASALPPPARLALIARFAERSAAFAAVRGYAPDLDALAAEVAAEAWEPFASLPQSTVERLQRARLQAEVLVGEEPPAPDRFVPARVTTSDGALVVRIRPRPWVLRSARRASAGWARLVGRLRGPN